MADYAEGFADENGNPAPAPPELFEAFLVEQWGAGAIYAGALPAGKLYRMTACMNVYRAVQSYRAGSRRLADWAQSHESYAKVIANIREMRLQNA